MPPDQISALEVKEGGDITLNRSSNLTPLRIALVVPLWARVPPKTYGGAELTLHWLTEELVQQGHDVTLFATGDARTNAKLHEVCEENLLDTMAKGQAYFYEYYAATAFAEALQQSETFDVIHSHIGAAMIPFSSFSKAPIVHTIHALIDSVDEHWLLQRFPSVPIAAISHSQIESIPAGGRTNIRVIYQGCKFDNYELSLTPENYFAFVGRMAPHKSPVDAIRIAREVGMPIVLAGTPQEKLENEYFATEVKPLIDGKNVVYRGAISQKEKVNLLKSASALLFPIAGPEPFGMVMLEALACGTPVIALNKGAVPEVIDFGKTGVYADSVEELVTLVPQVLSLDRKIVSDHAYARFSHKRMASDYLAMYRSLQKSGSQERI